MISQNSGGWRVQTSRSWGGVGVQTPARTKVIKIGIFIFVVHDIRASIWCRYNVTLEDMAFWDNKSLSVYCHIDTCIISDIVWLTAIYSNTISYYIVLGPYGWQFFTIHVSDIQTVSSKPFGGFSNNTIHLP